MHLYLFMIAETYWLGSCQWAIAWDLWNSVDLSIYCTYAKPETAYYYLSGTYTIYLLWCNYSTIIHTNKLCMAYSTGLSSWWGQFSDRWEPVFSNNSSNVTSASTSFLFNGGANYRSSNTSCWCKYSFNF